MNVEVTVLVLGARLLASFSTLTIMQKKGVQISSTTLNLRFMQNAKIQQEQRETEISQVNIQNEEQWHLNASEGWMESRSRTDSASQKRVTSASNSP